MPGGGWNRGRKSTAPRLTREERFWSKVNKDGPVFEDLGPCWVWTGSHNNYDYGNFMWEYLAGGKCKVVQAHNACLRILGIEAPAGKVPDHICKRRDCVNPAHIRFVTQEENCTVYAAPTPFFKNMQKTHCKRGHPFAGANLALFQRKDMKRPTRVCLTCWPGMWRWAVIPRTPPPGARKPREQSR